MLEFVETCSRIIQDTVEDAGYYDSEDDGVTCLMAKFRLVSLVECGCDEEEHHDGEHDDVEFDALFLLFGSRILVFKYVWLFLKCVSVVGIDTDGAD